MMQNATLSFGAGKFSKVTSLSSVDCVSFCDAAFYALAIIGKEEQSAAPASACTAVEWKMKSRSLNVAIQFALLVEILCNFENVFLSCIFPHSCLRELQSSCRGSELIIQRSLYYASDRDRARYCEYLCQSAYVRIRRAVFR